MEKPVLSRMQRAWLLELGIDARILAHLSAKPVELAAPPATVAQRAPDAEPAAVGAAEPPREGDGIAGIASIGDVLRRVPLAERAGLRPASDAGLPDTGSPPQARPAPRPAAEAANVGSDATTLQGLRTQADECTACGLHEVRARAVFGEGAERSPRWLFVGEAPGEYDDSTGRPFQGRAGALLQAMLASVGIDAGAPAYFTNVLKCRPMGNRSPQAAEVAACLPLLRRQIDLLRPACLVALGRVSAGALLGREDELEALRGSVHAYVGEDGRRIPLVVTHHPASLLLHAQLKAEAWRDLNLLRELGA